MKRLTRYVLWELSKAFFLTLLAMTLFMLSVGVIRESIRQGLALGPVLRIVPYILPEALRFSVPATMLLATCSVFGRMSADNEVVAIKSLGIHPRVLLAPALAFALVLSCVAVWLNDVAVTWGRTGMYRIVIESLEQIVYGMLRTQHYYTTGRFSISVKDVVQRKLVQPEIAIYPADDIPPITISARYAELQSDTQAKLLRILLTDGVVEQGDKSYEFPDTFAQTIPLADVHRRGLPGDSPSDCAMVELASQRTKEIRHIRSLEQHLAQQTAWCLLTGRVPRLQEGMLDETVQQLVAARDRFNRLRLEPWRRWANGFSCLAFVVLGAPLAVRMRTSNFFTTFAACFLPILVLYYPLMALVVDRAKDGAMPGFTVWLSNAVVIAIGLWHLRQVYRH